MVSLIFNLAVIFGVVLCVFYAARKAVMMWTGSTKEEAEKKIQALISQKQEYHLATDQMLITDIENAIHDVIGDVRYKELCRLAQTSPLIQSNYASGQTYISVTLNYADDNEKQRLEHILRDIVSKYLFIHGLCNYVLSDWKENCYLKMPKLMLRYAETNEQLKILKACLQEENTKIIEKNQPLKDEEI